MDERRLIRSKLNAMAIKIDQNSNEIEDSNVIFSSNINIQYKNSQDQILESSNCLFPRVISDFNQNNNISDIFITDKDKKTNENNDNNNNNEEVLPNLLKPLYFNQVTQKDSKKYDSKGTNRPSFSFDDETTPKKVCTKYKTIPWGFNTAISFPINESDNYMKYIKDQFNQVKEKNISMARHNSLKSSNFHNCFNNCMNNKLQIATDIKKIIHNCSKDDYEVRVKLIKNLMKTEMKNRSIGGGVFYSNNKFRSNCISQRKEKASQLKLEKEHNPIMINLKKKELFDKKEFDKEADIYFNRNFLRFDYDYHKAKKEKKNIERNKVKEYNTKVDKLYSKVKSKIDFDSHRDREVMNAIKENKENSI